MYYHLQKRKEMIFFLLNRVNIIQHGQLKWIERRDIVDNQRKSRADKTPKTYKSKEVGKNA